MHLLIRDKNIPHCVPFAKVIQYFILTRFAGINGLIRPWVNGFLRRVQCSSDYLVNPFTCYIIVILYYGWKAKFIRKETLVLQSTSIIEPGKLSPESISTLKISKLLLIEHHLGNT